MARFPVLLLSIPRYAAGLGAILAGMRRAFHGLSS
jgi:hypothetical protein